MPATNASTTSMTVPDRGGLVVPLMLWGRKCPRSRICAISALRNGRTIITGTVDGQLLQWGVDEPLAWIQPQMMLLAHECRITAIAPASTSSTATRFVSCSQDGHVCLWDSVDGRVVESVKNSSYVHRRIVPHQPSTSSSSSSSSDSTTNSNASLLFCTGDYAEIAVMDSQDLNILFNLSSRVEPDWVPSMTIVHPRDKYDVVIGVSLSGMIKLWSLTDLERRDATGSVVFEDESKLMPSRHVQSIHCSHLNTRMMLVICTGSWQILDPSNLNQIIVSECAIEALQGTIIDVDRVAIGFADSTVVLFQLPRSRLVGRQVREKFGEAPANLGNIDQPFVFALLKGIPTSPATPLWASVQFHFDTRLGGDGKLRRVAYRVDKQGMLTVWHIPKNYDLLVSEFLRSRRPVVYEPTLKQSLEDVWSRLDSPPPSLCAAYADEQEEADATPESSPEKITSTIYISNQRKLIFGRQDGSMLMMNACHAIMAQLLETAPGQEDVPHRVLNGHSASVTCFLYPFEESGGRYDAQLLLSGSEDFSIAVWNIVTGERMHRFCCQGGPIRRMTVTPANSSLRVQQCICSIAGDNSAALLSLKENKCVLLASRQQFPIVDVRWRPLDDFMLLRCEDDSVYVWQIETNNLDRIVTGLITEDVMEACKEQIGLVDVEDEAGASHAIQMLRAMRNKNLNAIKKIAAHIDDKGADGGCLKAYVPSELPSPMDVVQLNKFSDEAHLLLFNVDSLVAGLVSTDHELAVDQEQPQLMMPNQNSIEGKLSLQALIARKHEMNLQQREVNSAAAPNNGHSSAINDSSNRDQFPHRSYGGPESNLHMDTAHLLISLLHGWNLDSAVDGLCMRVLKLSRPKLPLCFGVISRRGHISLRMPYCSGKSAALVDHSYQHFSQAVRWQESKALTTVHLLSVVSLANTMMSLRGRYSQPALTKRFSLSRRRSSLSVEQAAADSAHAESEQQMVRHAWSNVAALHCVLLPDLVRPPQSYAAPRIDLLARRWQDSCVEIRDAAQALLIRELRRMNADGRKRLIATWSPFLPTLLDPSLSIFGNKLSSTNASYIAPAATKEALATTPTTPCNDIIVKPMPPPVPPPPLSISPGGRPAPPSGSSLNSQPPPHPPPIPPRHSHSPLPKLSGTDSSSTQSINSGGGGYNNNATLVTINTMSSASASSGGGDRPSTEPDTGSSAHDQRVNGEDVLVEELQQTQHEGRGGGIHQVRRNQATSIIVLGVVGAEFPAQLQSDPDLSRATSHSLLELLLAPESPLLPSNSPLRRAAIDLLGRGFVVWQPHLDIAKLLLALLDLAASGEKYLPHSEQLTVGQPLSPEADACRTARHSLSLIANARPQALISALSMEVARYNQAAQHQTIQHAVQSPLMKSRLEILRLIEQLSDKQYTCVADLINPVGDLLVHCLDTSLLKQKTLGEVFPPISKFYMVGYCPVTRRIAFGGKNGAVVVHELRVSKAQTVTCHQSPVTALAFSQDGKYLAVYSSQDAKISFLQTQQSFLGMGQSQIRCVRTMPAPSEFPVLTPGGSYQSFRARLVWINSKSLTLLLPNGKEHRFTL